MAEKVEISDAATRKIAAHCAMAGLCPLIPIPFVDDMIIKRIHRRLVRELFEQHELRLSPEGAKTLTSRESRFLAGALKSIVFWPIKKILRKVVYVLAIKSCADVAAAMFHEGWLMARALECRYVPLDELSHENETALQALRAGIIAARDSVDPSVTRDAMRSAFDVGGELFGSLIDGVRGALGSGSEEERLKGAEREAAPIARRIQASMSSTWSKGADLDAALRGALG